MSDKQSVVRKDAKDRDAPARANNSETGSRSESESVDRTVVEASSQANGTPDPGAELGETSTPIRPDPENRKSTRENKGLPPQRYGYVGSQQKGRGGRRGGTSRRTRGGMTASSHPEQARSKSADPTAAELTDGHVQLHQERRAESERMYEHSHRSELAPGSKSIISEISVSSSIARKRRELRQAEELDRLEEEAERKRLERKKAILKLHSELAELEEADLEEGEDQCSRKSEDSEILVKSKVLAWKESEGNNNEDGQLMRRQDQERRSHSFLRQTPTTTEVTGFEKYLARQAMTKDLPSFGGEVREWPLFFSTYKKSTEACGFSANENINRLQKCLKGAALEAVRSLLMTDREDEVIETLERRFGRPEYVIKDLMRNITSFPEIKENRLQSVLVFSDSVSNFVATVQALGKPQYLNNLMFLDQLVAKLPLTQKLQWAAVCEQETDVSNIAVFAQWIRRQANLVSKVYDPSVDKLETKLKKGAVIGAVLDKNNESVKCVYCDKDHHVSKCENIKDVSVDERWNWATKKRLCFSCLKPLHSIRDCKRRRCNKDGCPKRHHPLLHNDVRRSTETASLKNEEEFPEKAHINVVQRRKRHVFMRVLPVVLKGPAEEIDTYAYLDCGSSVTVIDSELARKLGLRGKLAPLEAEWTNGVTLSEPTSRKVNLSIRGPSDREFTLTDVQTQNTLNLPRSTVKIDTDVWQHLRGLPLSDILHAQPRILIGEDHGELLVARKSIFGPGNSPMASLTALGWVVHGKCKIERAEPEYVMFYHRTEKDDISLRMTDFWNTETFGVNPTAARLRSQEDQRAEELMNRTARRNGNRWEAGLLWKTDNETLPPSRKMAEKRFVALERKMDRDPAFRHEYEKKIQDYQEKGYALRLTKEEAAQEGARTWYLPHFAVFNANKPGKMRLVFDAAAKSHGVSLNDRLLKGPDLLGSLVGVLFRFRERAVAIGGDLKEMFHQVRIRKEDRCSQRILGRDKETNEIFVFEMQVMIFGAVSSPYVAQEIRNRNAKEFEDKFPDAYLSFTQKHYMDDYLDSLDTITEAIQRAKEVSFIHQKGGFEIRNWVTNSKEVRESLPQDAIATGGSQLSFSSEDYQRVLGVIWVPDSDIFTFTTEFPKLDKRVVTAEKPPTKRDVLKLIMSVFDPLGLLAVMSIRAKILMQDIWRSGSDWDQPLSENLSEKWRNWLQLLDSAAALRIPRSYVSEIGEVKDSQLHVFCDASQQAFASVAFLRLEGENGVQKTLVMSKSRVAPLKPMTIPRLELQAAVMGSRLANFISSEHSISIGRKIMWTDSQTVLRWIRSDARKYQTFVAHRIGEILESTAQNEWRWVPTNENVADEATRDTYPLEIMSTNRWFMGPEFLRRHESEWPQDFLSEQQQEEILDLKKEFCGTLSQKVNIDVLIDFSRFSKWQRLIRTWAWTQLAAKKWRNWKRSQDCKDLADMILTVPEVQQAEVEILKMTQADSFPEDREMLRKKKNLAPSSRLYQLSPMMGPDGLIRMDGRIRENSAVSQATRQPVILEGKHPAVRLLIHHFHLQAGHHGRERVLNDLKQLYWILKARAAVKSTWNSCQDCKNRRAQPRIPAMAQLPIVRTDGSQYSFTNVGVDYFGPYQVAIGRRREKRYGVLFTCLAYRAVHLEIAHSLSTDSMIMALRRMMNRRGKPKLIMSDNGTNFVGGERELREALAELEGEELQRRAAEERIEWKFISPMSPHMGGCWERLVRSVKRSFSATLKEQVPKEEVLQTLFTEAEYSVNSRPLTYVSDDPSDVQSLTPMHFLRVSPGEIPSNHGAPGVFEERVCILRKQWRKAQYFADQFWRRWIREYLPTINKRTKWYQDRGDLIVGDLVIIADSRQPRNQWLKGRITTVYPGDDGRVRIADVKTTTGTYRRPAIKLFVLEVNGCNAGAPELQEGECCGR